MEVKLLFLACLILAVQTQEGSGENPPEYGYDNLPETRFTCEGKLQGRYYADPDTDCQMFHVCVKMSKRETQDFRFLCPNGTVFDQEHLVCADFYQVSCSPHQNSGPYGHIFEFLKLTASKEDSTLDFGKVPSRDPEYLGRNTLGGDDFQVEEYNNNKLASQGNSLQYTQNVKPKEIQFPTTRKATTTTPRPTTTYRTTTRPTTTERPTQSPTTTSQVTYAYASTDAPNYYYQSSTAFPYDETTGVQSTTFQNNFNFHRETDVPQSFPTTTRRPDFYSQNDYSANSNNDYNANNNNDYNANNNNNYYNSGNSGVSEYTTSTTYAPPTTTASSFTNNYNRNNNYYRETTTTSFPTTYPTTTRRPTFYQSTFRTTTLEPSTTPAPVQQEQQSTFQQQPSRFSDDYFRKIPTTEQSTTVRTQNLFYGGNPQQPRQTTYAPTTTFRSTNNYYSTPEDQTYLQQGRSINSSPIFKTDRPKQFATKPTPAPEYYTTTTSAPSTPYYEPIRTRAPQYFQPREPISPVEPVFVEEIVSTDPPTTTTTTTTTTTVRPVRRGGRRRVNPNRQRNPGPRNFDPQVKYSRRIESTQYNEQESFGVQQKTEEIFNAEASVFPRNKANNLYIEQERQPKEQEQNVQSPPEEPVTPASRRPNPNSFGGENFGRKIRPGRIPQQQIRRRPQEEQQPEQQQQQPQQQQEEYIGRREAEVASEGNSRPQGGRIIKRLRPKSTTPATTTIPYEPAPFSPSTSRPVRVSVRTRTVVAGSGSGLIENFNTANNGNGNGEKRRVVIKKLRPKTSTASPDQEIITASTPDSSNNYNNDFSGNYNPVTEVFTTLKVEETFETTATTPRPFGQSSNSYSARNLTATVGGFKVTVISKSSDQQTSTSDAEPQSTPLSVYKPKASFPKLNKKLINGGISSSSSSSSQTQNRQQIQNQQGDQQISGSSIDKAQQKSVAGPGQSPDYDYSYYNTDDESQYVAEHNSPDRLYGKRARNKVVGVAAPAYDVGDVAV